VDWHSDKARCHLSIADNGPGMTPEQLAHLFEPFNRLGATHSRIEGTGIGLVVSQGLIRLMQGELAIDSRTGQGTVVTLSLINSARRALDAAPDAAWRPSLHGALEGGLRVMYVEDNEVNVEVLQAVVALRPGIALEAVSSGAQALARARRDPPDLMLLDMHLGDMTGHELARALRADPITAAVPLVAVSADALPEQIDAALAQGFEAYLTKPVDFKALLRLLDEVAAR
jgi:CheY-like chemotaxis protein